MYAAVLYDRGVVEVAGPEAGDLLQRLVTNDVLGLAPHEARYAALLTPQGKILVDFLAVACGEPAEPRMLLDCPRVLAPDLAKRLTLYRLRAKVMIADRSADLAVAAVWPERPESSSIVYRDPRAPSLGFRVIAPAAELAAAFPASDPEAYREARVRAGVPDGGTDFAFGETFPHEANLDKLKGVDFTKGCYVGQEVVSRVEHRGTARKRVVRVAFEGDAPPRGSDVLAGETVVGTMGSAVPGVGLAMLRLDRAAEAAAGGLPLTSAGTGLTVLA